MRTSPYTIKIKPSRLDWWSAVIWSILIGLFFFYISNGTSIERISAAFLAVFFTSPGWLVMEFIWLQRMGAVKIIIASISLIAIYLFSLGVISITRDISFYELLVFSENSWAGIAYRYVIASPLIAFLGCLLAITKLQSIRLYLYIETAIRSQRKEDRN